MISLFLPYVGNHSCIDAPLSSNSDFQHYTCSASRCQYSHNPPNREQRIRMFYRSRPGSSLPFELPSTSSLAHKGVQSHRRGGSQSWVVGRRTRHSQRSGQCHRRANKRTALLHSMGKRSTRATHHSEPDELHKRYLLILDTSPYFGVVHSPVAREEHEDSWMESYLHELHRFSWCSELPSSSLATFRSEKSIVSMQ